MHVQKLCTFRFCSHESYLSSVLIETSKNVANILIFIDYLSYGSISKPVSMPKSFTEQELASVTPANPPIFH